MKTSMAFFTMALLFALLFCCSSICAVEQSVVVGFNSNFANTDLWDGE